MSNLRARLGLKDGGSLRERLGLKEGGPVRMQEGGDPAEQMFNFNPMAAQAMRQERMRREAEEAKRYKSVMGTTPQDLLRRVEPPPAEMSALPLSQTPTKLDRLARSGLEALGMPKPRAQSVASNVKGAIEMLVPDPERIYREMSEATQERDPAKFALANLEAGLGYMPFAKPVVGAAKAIGTAALDAGKVAGREALRPIDQAMFGEGPLAGVFSYAAPLQAAPKMQAPVSPLGFYNPVEQAALNVQRKQGPGQAFLNELQRGENVSKDFLQSSGLAERLAAMPNVTREEVQRMAKGSVPEVEEIVRGEQFSKAIEQEQKAAGQLVEMIDNNLGGTIRLQNTVGPVYSDEALYYLQDGTAKPEQFPEHLQGLARQYVQLHQKAKTTENLPAIYNREDLILPGGENYREVLLKLPTNKVDIKIPDTSKWSVVTKDVTPISGSRRIQVRDDQGNLVGQRFGFTGSDQQAIDEVFYHYLNQQKQIQQEQLNYISNHWRNTPNVLSHIRMNDRTDAEGKKVLFIEELQSDWAQEGRKKGFGDKDAKIQELVKQRDSLPDDSPEQEAIQQQINELGVQDKGVPSAPFVQNTKDWVDLSLKNILKRAVDEGYDRVAFINGKQSADRYKLTNYVDKLKFVRTSGGIGPGPDELGDGMLIGYDKNGKTIIEKYISDPTNQLPDYIGKEPAQKILEQNPQQGRFGGMGASIRTLQGESLEVGGTGMKKFYDEIVPERVRKLVGKNSLRDIQFEDKTAKLREELANATPGSSRYLYLTDKIGQLERDAERYGALGNQLGFDITPEIREKFSKPIPYKKGGAVHISDNPDVMALELTMAGGGAARKALETMAKQAEKRGLVRDPRFKMAPGSAENLAGKSYAQWAAEQQYKHELEDALAKLSGVPGKSMSIQDIPVGSRLISIIGDRTQADKVLKSVNETPLVNEVYLFGGPRFGQGKLAQGKEEFWASQAGAAQAVQNRAEEAAKRAKGKPVIGVYTAMGAKDSDMYAKHFAEALIEQYPYMSMTNKQIDGFNKQFRKQYPQFAGVDSPEFVDQIMNNSDMRKAFVTEHLKKKNIKDFGIPDGLATRHAITVPELRDVPSGLAGYSMGELKPGEVLQKGSYIEHPTYNTVIPGRYIGGLEIMQDYRDLFPDATKRMLETLKNNPKFQGPSGKNPESQLFGTFGLQGAEQEVTQKLIDELATREELIKKLGVLPYKKGGKVKKVKVSKNPDVMRLELLRKKHA